jgi:hypothetical protein
MEEDLAERERIALMVAEQFKAAARDHDKEKAELLVQHKEDQERADRANAVAGLNGIPEGQYPESRAVGFMEIRRGPQDPQDPQDPLPKRKRRRKPKFPRGETSTGYPPGAIILSRDGLTRWEVQVDGSHRRMPGMQTEAERAAVARKQELLVAAGERSQAETLEQAYRSCTEGEEHPVAAVDDGVFLTNRGVITKAAGHE